MRGSVNMTKRKRRKQLREAKDKHSSTKNQSSSSKESNQSKTYKEYRISIDELFRVFDLPINSKLLSFNVASRSNPAKDLLIRMEVI